MALLIKGGTLVTMNSQRSIINADILIEKDIIADIGRIAPERADHVIQAKGKLVIPGLIQAHTHLCQCLFRGMADDLELLNWLSARIWPLEAAHDEDSIYDSARLACGELLRGGTTSVVDMGTVNYTDDLLEAVAEAGIRYRGGKCMMDCTEEDNPLCEHGDDSLQDSIDILERWHNKENQRIRYAFCPRFVPTCSEYLLREVKQLADRYKVGIHTHAAENVSEIALVEEAHGMRNIVYLNSLGLCNKDLVLAHCIHLDQVEKQILAQSGTNVVHCPSSNLKLASGIADIPGLLKKNINISLGADGAPCNNNMDMFMEMRLAALIHKPFNGPASMPAEKVFEMATLGGARAMGLEDEIGSLEIGKKADLAIISLDHWHNWPENGANVYSQLVYQTQNSDVYCTIVDGKVLMLKGQVLSIDQDEVHRKAQKSLLRVGKRAGIF